MHRWCHSGPNGEEAHQPATVDNQGSLFTAPRRGQAPPVDAITATLHLTPSHQGRRNTDARILFTGSSSALNTLVAPQQVEKLRKLQVVDQSNSWDHLSEHRRTSRLRSELFGVQPTNPRLHQEGGPLSSGG